MQYSKLVSGCVFTTTVLPCHFPLKTVPKDPEPILWPRVIWPSGISQSSLESRLPRVFCSTWYRVSTRSRSTATQPYSSNTLTILLRSSDEEDDLRSLCWHGDFCGTLFVNDPGRDAGGVAESPVVEPEEDKPSEKVWKDQSKWRRDEKKKQLKISE